MDEAIREAAANYLKKLIGHPLLYALKSPDTELYDFGLGILKETVNRWGKSKEIGQFVLHALCRFEVIWRNCNGRVDKYYEDTPNKKFHADVQYLLGQKVERVALSSKNDLWLDFGDYWIVFATFENGEESWRFFMSDTDAPHLIASDSWLEFTGDRGTV